MSKPKMILPIKKKGFGMILSGEKKEEYRKLTSYYESRIRNVIGSASYGEFILNCSKSEPFEVLFRNGYSSQSPSFVAKVSVRIGFGGKEEIGVAPGVEYFVFDILEILQQVPLSH